MEHQGRALLRHHFATVCGRNRSLGQTILETHARFFAQGALRQAVHGQAENAEGLVDLLIASGKTLQPLNASSSR